MREKHRESESSHHTFLLTVPSFELARPISAAFGTSRGALPVSGGALWSRWAAVVEGAAGRCRIGLVVEATGFQAVGATTRSPMGLAGLTRSRPVLLAG